MSLVLVVVVLAVIAIVGLVLFLTRGQRLKGGIELSLGSTHFGPGQDIAGVLTVTAKKPLGPGRLFTSLVCIEEWWEWETDSDGDRSRQKKTREVYRHDLDVAHDLSIGQGQRHTAPFVLPTPQPQDTVDDGDTPGWLKALATIADSLSDDREAHWKVAGRYDIKGLDLTTEQRIPLTYEFR